MATITLSGLDEKFVRRFGKQPAANGRTVEDEIRHILEQSVGLDPEAMAARKKAFLEYARELRRMTAGRAQTPSEILIRQDRDSDHGRLCATMI